MVHNESALGPLLEAFRTAGRRVGEDLSVLALCPDDLAEQATPPLTSIAIPAEEVGRQAVGLLMAKLDGQPVPAATLLAPQLTVRASTRAAAADLTEAANAPHHRQLKRFDRQPDW